MIHENFIETHSIAYVLNECYDIETGNYNITRENLITEIQNRFIPKTSSTTINNTISFLSKSTMNFNETIPETALYDLYRSIIDHEHTQNIPYSLSGNMILFKNRVGFIHEKPLSNDSLSDIDHLYEKLLADCLNPEDFQNNQRDSQTVSQLENYSWNTEKITTSFESYPLLKNRLFATLQLQVISTTIKELLNSAYNFNSWPQKSLLKKLKRMAITYKTFLTVYKESNKDLESSMDDIDFSALHIENSKSSTEKCVYEVFKEHFSSSARFFDGDEPYLNFTDKSSLKLLHFLNDTNQTYLANSTGLIL